MPPTRTFHLAVPSFIPSTPYKRPQYDTARALFQRMIEEPTASMPAKPLFSSNELPVTPSSDSTPHTPTETTSASIMNPPASAAMPCTPPSSLPRNSWETCPKLYRPRKNVSLGSPIQLAPISLNWDVQTIETQATPRKRSSTPMVAPWAPRRPSVRPSSTYNPRPSFRQPCFQQSLLGSSPSSSLSISAKDTDCEALFDRIHKLERTVRKLQRELAEKSCVPSSTPTKPARQARALKSSQPRPIRADSVFL